LYHPLGAGAFGYKPLYSQGFLRFSVFYLGIRGKLDGCYRAGLDVVVLLDIQGEGVLAFESLP